MTRVRPKSVRRTRPSQSAMGGRTALYRHYDVEDVLLYVGISGTPENRTRWHKRNAEWIERAVRFTGVWYPTRAAALIAEAKAIREESPQFNRQGIRSRPGFRTAEPAGDRRYTFRIDGWMVDEIDNLAAEQGITRSTMLRTLLDEGKPLRLSRSA